MSEHKDPSEIAVAAALSENGIELKSKSHAVAELDRLFGEMIAALRFKTGLGGYVKSQRLMRERADAVHAQVLHRITNGAAATTLDDFIDDAVRRSYVESLKNQAAVFDQFIEHSKRHTEDSDTASADTAEEAQSAFAHDEDWIDSFKRLMDTATTERAQALFGRILAGEFHRPTDITIATIRTIAELPPSVASRFEACMPYVFDDRLIVDEKHGGIDPQFEETSEFEDYGLINSASLKTWVQGDNNDNGVNIIQTRGKGLWFKNTNHSGPVRLEGIRLTTTGRNLSKIINMDTKGLFAKIVECLADPDSPGIYGDIIKVDGGYNIASRGAIRVR